MSIKDYLPQAAQDGLGRRTVEDLEAQLVMSDPVTRYETLKQISALQEQEMSLHQRSALLNLKRRVADIDARLSKAGR